MSFLDSLTAAFKGGGTGRVPLTQGYIAPWAVPLGTVPGRQGYDYGEAIVTAFERNPVAQRAIRIVAEAVGSAPLVMESEAIGELMATNSGGQPLLDMLAVHLLLHGNAYVQAVKDARGDPVDLFALRPERVEVVPGADGWPVGYDYRVGANVERILLEDEQGWPNILHLRALHPAGDHYGGGCLSAAQPAVAIHNAASAWNRALLENAARPSGALIYKTDDAASLTSDQFDRLKSELTEAFAGDRNAGRPMLLEGGLSWQSLSMSPADMDFATLKAAAARDIALAFGVPPMLLGLPGDNTHSNYREANRALWRLTLLPLADKILTGLSRGLRPWFGATRLSVDLDRIPALAEDRERLWSQVTGADFLSAEEKRAMLGIKP